MQPVFARTNTIISFMYHVNNILAEGKIYADEALLKYKSAMAVELPKLVLFLNWFPVRDKTLTYAALNKTAYGMLPEAQFPVLAEFLNGSSFNKKAAEWEHYLKSSRLITLKSRVWENHKHGSVGGAVMVNTNILEE
ncbi:hypothetical protein Lfee_1523 [Legionella feeleii]|uniref:Uncharacterized protein n=2 Tax=Legionella feeleii TaxID=453 RepID=A0A0W0TS85_9GAMM|nr:hypothetical protein Lfee_1523 [Legionella feeleii]